MIRSCAVCLIFAASLTACSGSAGPAGATGAPGKQGKQGPPGAPGGTKQSISGVAPNIGYLARKGSTTISGFGTSWSVATSVDFGVGVTTTSVLAASPTALLVEYTIDPKAPTGPHDVNVTDMTGNTTYSAGFNVAPPMVTSTTGTWQQGSLAYLDVQVEDLTTILDTTTGFDAAGNTTYPNLKFVLPAGMTVQSVSNVFEYSARALVSIDVDTKSATSDFDLVSGPPGATTNIHFPVPGGVSVGPRAPTVLTSGTATPGSVITPFGSWLYSFTQGSAVISIVDFAATSTVSGTNPQVLVLPKSGHFADLLGFGASFTTINSTTDPFYVIYWDAADVTGAYSVAATATLPAFVLPTVPGDGTKATAVNASALPFVLTNGAFADASSMDWVKVTTGAGDAGKTLLAQTVGDPLTDVLLTIYGPAGTKVLAQQDGGNVSASTTVAASTVYYVSFAAGFFFGAADNTYEGIIRLQ